MTFIFCSCSDILRQVILDHSLFKVLKFSTLFNFLRLFHSSLLSFPLRVIQDNQGLLDPVDQRYRRTDIWTLILSFSCLLMFLSGYYKMKLHPSDSDDVWKCPRRFPKVCPRYLGEFYFWNAKIEYSFICEIIY